MAVDRRGGPGLPLTIVVGCLARQEYLAVCLRVALHPMADLAFESGDLLIPFGFGLSSCRQLV